MADARTPGERQFLTPFAELVDRLTVDQIKAVLLPEGQASYSDEMRRISHDLDLIIQERGLRLDGRMIRILVALGQMNLHIWHLKDRMQAEPDRYEAHLKLAHHLNGIQNQLKNRLLEEAGEREKATERSNSGVDGLEGWHVDLV